MFTPFGAFNFNNNNFLIYCGRDSIKNKIKRKL